MHAYIQQVHIYTCQNAKLRQPAYIRSGLCHHFVLPAGSSWYHMLMSHLHEYINKNTKHRLCGPKS